MRSVKIFNDPKAFELAADKTRRRIIHLLRARVLSVSQIADELDMTPQAIYHHINKMLEVGLIEVAKEERVDHFIETYYQASAEIFQFNYEAGGDKEYSEARTKATLDALNQIGLMKPMDDEIVSRFAAIRGKMNLIHRDCSLDVNEKISQIDGLDMFTKQDALEIACKIKLSNEQFNETQRLDKEIRDLLKPLLITGNK